MVERKQMVLFAGWGELISDCSKQQAAFSQGYVFGDMDVSAVGGRLLLGRKAWGLAIFLSSKCSENKQKQKKGTAEWKYLNMTKAVFTNYISTHLISTIIK